MAGPRLMNSGKEAMAAVAKVLPTAHSLTVPSSLGPVELKPGTIWRGNKMLFYCAPLYVWYAIDDRIYECGTSDFIRDEWFNALAAGAQRAAHMVTLAKVEFALISGILCPWYLMLGMGCAKVGLFYSSNKSAVDTALSYAPKVINLLRDLKQRSPTLFNKLMATAAKDLLINLPSGVTAEDVAFFIGRAIKGAVGASPDLAVGAIIKIVGSVAAIVTATHLPSIAAHAVGSAAASKAKELRMKLLAFGYTVSEAEAKTILAELMSKTDTRTKLQELETACKAFLPSLEVLNRAYSTMP
ncbi:MAG: hypothetical protein MN733_41855 [Nitrososphaera sp.]|nr:hypothetical protein [Nitrososphaera sp.]